MDLQLYKHRQFTRWHLLEFRPKMSLYTRAPLTLQVSFVNELKLCEVIKFWIMIHFII